MSKPVVAAFDFDGTLTRSDSVVPFLRAMSGSRPLWLRLVPKLHRVVLAGARRDRDRLRAIATAAVFRGMPAAEVEARAVEYGEQLLSRIRDDTLARLGWHRDQGHHVVIVSASYELYVRVVADRLGAGYVATRLATGPDGACTGALDGGNCRAAAKVRRLDAWLAERGMAREGVELWAYGDSAGDRELLAVADHPVWVRAPLASVAPASA